jgi:hypothetical protein
MLSGGIGDFGEIVDTLFNGGASAALRVAAGSLGDSLSATFTDEKYQIQ